MCFVCGVFCFISYPWANKGVWSFFDISGFLTQSPPIPFLLPPWALEGSALKHPNNHRILNMLWKSLMQLDKWWRCSEVFGVDWMVLCDKLFFMENFQLLWITPWKPHSLAAKLQNYVVLVKVYGFHFKAHY